jgi:glycosyltransferase involved in cell wall biosynthesis
MTSTGMRNNNVKKILYIHHNAGWGGAPNSLIRLINDLDRTKYEVEVLLLKDSIIGDKLTENLIRYSIADSLFYRKYYQFFLHSEAGYLKWYQILSFIKLSTIWILSRYFFAEKELARHDFDMVHLNSLVLTDWLAPAKKRGKVIIHVREPLRKGNLDFLHHFIKSGINKYADKIVAISLDNARRIGLPAKTVVIYNYSEIPETSPSESSYASKKVLYLGGSDTSKGFYTLVLALDHLDKDVKVYFGGKYVITRESGNFMQILKFILSRARMRNAAIQKIRNHPNAVIIGLVYEVNDYLDEVCCLVSPFLVPHFSRPVIEAHLHKKPAIVSNVEGMEEIILHEKTGLIVAKNNPGALAVAINELTANSHKVKRLGEEGYKLAIKKFTPGNIKQFELLYDQLLNEN